MFIRVFIIVHEWRDFDSLAYSISTKNVRNHLMLVLNHWLNSFRLSKISSILTAKSCIYSRSHSPRLPQETMPVSLNYMLFKR